MICFQCRNEFCIQKCPIKRIYIGLAEKAHFPRIFTHSYSLVILAILSKSLKILIWLYLASFPPKVINTTSIGAHPVNRLSLPLLHPVSTTVNHSRFQVSVGVQYLGHLWHIRLMALSLNALSPLLG